MASTGATSVTSRPIRSSILTSVASKWSKPASRRSTASFKWESELFRSERVSPRPPSTSSNCPTVTSAFIAAWVSVLIRCLGGRLPALLSAMRSLLLPGREPPDSNRHLIGYATQTLRTLPPRRDDGPRATRHHSAAAGLRARLHRSAGRAAPLAGKFGCRLVVEEPDRVFPADRTGGRHRHGVGAADRGGHRLGFLRAGHQYPHLARALDCRQCQRNSLRRRLG